MNLKIETGKFYRTRDGRKVGPMTDTGGHFRWGAKLLSEDMTYWTDDGMWLEDVQSSRDIIAEWTDEFEGRPVPQDSAWQPETGTLAELNVKPGDVVQATHWDNRKPMPGFYNKVLWTVYSRHPLGYTNNVCAVYTDGIGGYSNINDRIIFRIVSRAAQPETLKVCKTCNGSGVVDEFSTWEESCPDCKSFTQSEPEIPKLWRDMTSEERGALLLARYEGATIERYGTRDSIPGWYPTSVVNFAYESAYRVRSNPKRETKTIWWGSCGFTLTYKSDRDTHQIDFDEIDGEPDCDSIRMEKIKKDDS